MAGNEIDKNDQAAKRTDGNEPGTWPGSGTTVEGTVDTATSGILAGAPAEGKGSASTSAKQQEPEALPAERAD
jgi:hypothetical protein